MVSAKKELELLKPSEKKEKEALKKVQTHLDKGMKALEKRQKHIKVADRLDYGWSTVQHYDLNPLASDSDDEKRLERRSVLRANAEKAGMPTPGSVLVTGAKDRH